MPISRFIAAKSGRKTPYSIPVRNEVTGLQERLTVSKETLDKFKDAGKPRRLKYPDNKPLIKRIDLEEQARTTIEHEEDQDRMRKVSHLMSQLSLLDRIEKQEKEQAEKLTLLQRIEERNQRAYIPTPNPLPASLHFRKTKLMLRQQEFEPMITAACQRLEPVLKKLDASFSSGGQSSNHQLNTRREKAQLLIGRVFMVEQWFKENHTDKMTNREWRMLKKDLKSLGRISFVDIHRRWGYILELLEGLFDMNAFVYAEME